MGQNIRCPRCQYIKSWSVRRGKRRCAACRYEWVPRALPLRLTPAEWRRLLRWFILDIQRYVLDKGLMFMPVTGTRLWAWRERVEGFAPNFAASEYFHWARLRVRGG